MIAIPLGIIFALVLCGMTFYSSMEYFVGPVPAGMHDLYYFLILSSSICFSDRRKSYLFLVSWFVAVIFANSFLMQLIDFRPVGDQGEYNLYTDNIVNSLTVLSLILTVSFLCKKHYIRYQGRLLFLCVTSIFFLAFNLLLTVNEVRGLFSNYAMVYDTVFYLYLYAVCISANNAICNAISSGYSRFCFMLRYSYSYLLSRQKQ